MSTDQDRMKNGNDTGTGTGTGTAQEQPQFGSTALDVDESGCDCDDDNDDKIGELDAASASAAAILCFEHCDRRTRVFCFELPSACPLCGHDLSTADLRIPLFRIPFPFTSPALSPCAVLIRPTVGDFLHNYQNSTDLHIGVTDSQGIVYEYDRSGLNNNGTTRWRQCLAINIIKKLDAKWKAYWDYTLQIVSQQEKWAAARYKEDDFNCYTFVLAFLRTLQVETIRKSVLDKMDFCRDFILPRTISAGKYISLYRKILQEKVVTKS